MDFGPEFLAHAGLQARQDGRQRGFHAHDCVLCILTLHAPRISFALLGVQIDLARRLQELSAPGAEDS
jgi:hypothetical protein